MTTAKRLRIGITCYPTFGGSGIIATEIGLQLARLGHSVHLIAYAVPGRLDRFVENMYFHEVEMNVYPLFDQSPYATTLASKMVEVATNERLDLLHVHYAIPHATSAYLARQILGPTSPRIITTLHGTDVTLVGSDRTQLPITRFSIMQSDGLTAPSEYLARATHELIDVPDSVPIEVIPNFVDTELYSPAPNKQWSSLQNLFPDVPATPRPRVLIHNSNFRPLKRVEDVMRIFERVARQLPCVLALVGDGPDRARVESLASELGLAQRVCFLGKQLSFVEVLKQADVFLLPSETESFGLAALEAQSCAIPVVASDVGGVHEVVRHGETGYLCKLGDIDEMAAQTLRLLKDDSLCAGMAQAARKRAESLFRRDPMVDRYVEYYRRVLG